MRIETDSFGDIDVADDALYGAQTARAIQNFQISSQRMPDEFIFACICIKKAAALANKQLSQLPEDIADSIVAACEQVQALDFSAQFPIDVYQTGSGTSTNMNVNEVLANLASKESGQVVSANDHVNFGQSSNDVIPTAIQVSAVLSAQQKLLPSLAVLIASIDKKASTLTAVVKTGRTHLMDAMPLSFAQELSAWSEQLKSVQSRLNECLPRLSKLPQGGTAVGTGINANKQFALLFCKQLTKQTSTEFSPHENFFYGLSSQDASLELSANLKSLAVALIKICNDLRWMNSGPLAGLAEIALPALQPGSSIMPGKVNPVIPEAVIMVAYQVIGFDAANTLAAQSGNFQLNVCLPMIANNLLTSISMLAKSCSHLAEKSINGFTVKQQKIDDALSKNPILVTALNNKIGYLKAAEIAKQAYAQQRPVLDVAAEMTDISLAELQRILDPRKLCE